MINRLKPPLAAIKLLYQVFLLPILEYWDVVWQPTNVTQTRRLERFQSKYTSTDASISSQGPCQKAQVSYHFINLQNIIPVDSNLSQSSLNMLSMLQGV